MNIEQIFAMVVGIFSIMGIFYGMLRNFKIDILDRIDNVETGLNKRIDGLDKRIDSLHETVQDIDRRLCRLEGAFSSKEFCGLKNHDTSKHAE